MTDRRDRQCRKFAGKNVHGDDSGGLPRRRRRALLPIRVDVFF